SPWVVMPRISTPQCGCKAARRSRTCSACHMASRLSREAMTSLAGEGALEGAFTAGTFRICAACSRVPHLITHPVAYCCHRTHRPGLIAFASKLRSLAKLPGFHMPKTSQRRVRASASNDKDLPLKEDIRLLGRLLGNVLREQEGEQAFQVV